MPPTYSSPEVVILGQGSTLAWAATSAVGLSAPQVVQAALVLMLQQRFNAALPVFQGLGINTARIAEDGQWGRQSSRAALLFIAAARADDEPMQIFTDTGMVSAWDMANTGAALGTVSTLRSRYGALRNAVTAYGNRTQGVARNLADNGAALLGAVQNAATTADVGSRATTLLGTMFQVGGASAGGNAAPTVVSTRTSPPNMTSVLDKATQVPSGAIPVISPGGNAAAEFTFDQPLNVQADTFGRRLNLKIVIPVLVIGTLLTVAAMKPRGSRAR